jgi:hypothetical protein
LKILKNFIKEKWTSFLKNYKIRKI